jgi:AraC-like DNA-binding protein
MQVGVSPFYLVRAFTRRLGLAPHQYLVQTRVRRACDLLAGGVAPSFVAAMTGFVDQSHLTTHFKRYVGTTPASYQQSMAPRHVSRLGISPQLGIRQTLRERSLVRQLPHGAPTVPSRLISSATATSSCESFPS